MSLSRNALIIDDELDICMLLSNILRQQSFKTNYALNLHDAQEQLNENAPDIVLLDLNLPDGSGFDIIPTLKAANPNVTIIIQSAHDGIEEKEKALHHGIDHFFSKPINVAELKAVIAS
ncbi:MAG: response regulator [Crocinitomicaceae bacterium]|nr:response regulator [Crocinitomicaceae bacterium]|tara:strand:- start:562 stop:918 length:357 start_codon:yes stop_codon:yes gene_type:complete